MKNLITQAIKQRSIIHKTLCSVAPRFKFSSPPQLESQRFSDQFLNGTNAEFVEQLYDRWYDNAQSVPAQWDAYFKQVTKHNLFDFVQEPQLGQQPADFGIVMSQNVQNGALKYIGECFRVRQLINRYRNKGHEHADLDPLRLEASIRQIGKAPPQTQIHYSSLGFTEADLQREFQIQDKTSDGITSHEKQRWKLADLVNYLDKVYCGKVGYEYSHLTSTEQRAWIRDRIENYEEFKPTKQQRLLTFDRLCKQYCFSTFLDKKFNTSKRFGIDGLDSMVSGLLTLVDIAAKNKVEHLVFGMAHRGRLETLYSVFQKSAEEIMAEFQDLKSKYSEEDWGNSGDVKYHLGCTNELNYDGHQIRLNILPNPSHLEAVNPLVYGKIKSIQDYLKDNEGKKAVGVVIHGDAACSGQGIVYESFQFQDLDNYKSGGIIHVVANNQIGFTTVPKDARSGVYCTDVAKVVEAPIFHVNADEPDLVDKVFQIASEFRMKFHHDVVIDVVGYRRYGHNELDQPSFTQPIMYSKIKQTPPVFEKYSQKLLREGIITQEELQSRKEKFYAELEVSYQQSRKMEFNIQSWKPQIWEQLQVPKHWGAVKDTGVLLKDLKEVAQTINKIDPNFNVNPQIKKFYENRLNSVLKDSGIDFATAEALAFGTLLKEGYHIRLSGQDVERATFSHRHALLNDQVNPNAEKFMPLRNMLPESDKQRIVVANSHLSEFGVLGFEYGYTLSNPNCLVMWEAQFGDFANGAQVMIDNYITSAETKWGVDSGIVLLLPNGMDGQGPEHSSGRIERYLQLSDDDPTIYELDNKIRPKRQIQSTNIQVCQCTTPSNYFHVLRRQMRRQFRKPLILMVSKKLLRYVPSNSQLVEFDQGNRFHTAYPEKNPEEILPPNEVQKVLVCSGQIYYDLLKRRQELKDNKVAIIRIEQLAPFPYVYVHQILEKYTKAKFYWVQEEHENFGAWNFIRPRLTRILSTISLNKEFAHHSIHFNGRKPSSSPATGFLKQHERELERILSKSYE